MPCGRTVQVFDESPGIRVVTRRIRLTLRYRIRLRCVYEAGGLCQVNSAHTPPEGHSEGGELSPDGRFLAKPEYPLCLWLLQPEDLIKEAEERLSLLPQATR